MFGKPPQPREPWLPRLPAQDDAGVTAKAVPWAKTVSRGRWQTYALESTLYSRQSPYLPRQPPLSHEHSGQSSATDGDFTYRCNYREILLILQSIRSEMVHRTPSA